MSESKIWSLIFSDLLVNLAAGWFGAILIVPNYSSARGKTKIIVLISDFVSAILCLAIAFLLKR